LLETIEDAAPEDLRKKSRDFLGAFLFTGEDVDKKVKVLSGGEKGRVALCKLLLFPHNLLIMDEPTNHLDLKSKDMLKNALKQYDGTLIVVSHDRHFLQGLTDKIYEFRDGKVNEFVGDIDEYLEERKLEDFRQLEQEKSATKIEAAAVEKAKVAETGLGYKERKQLEKDLRKAEREVEKLEKQIEKLESDLALIDDQLNDTVKFAELSKQPDFYAHYEADKEKLAKMMKDWEKAELVLSKVQNKKEAH
jgi:ATP-binding cassette subfamily F protein 3